MLTGGGAGAGRWSVADLRALLAGDDRAGELVVQYQPVVATGDTRPLGVEALVRWRLPAGRGGTLVPPGEFVAAAERSGLGPELDEQVLRRTLHQLSRWDASGVVVHRVGVNLGRSSTLRPDLTDVVADACAQAGLEHGRLMLEVVEHDQPDLSQGVLDRFQDLADEGVTIAVDDFGSGFASAAMLGALPVGVLKTDRVLLPAPGRPAARSSPCPKDLLRGVVAMAAAVGAEVTAEGVETPQQLAVLRQLGVPHAQGWCFAPALDADAVLEHWLSWSPWVSVPVPRAGRPRIVLPAQG